MSIVTVSLVAVTWVALATGVKAASIDLNGFLGIPPQDVTIAEDGSSAVLEESLGFLEAMILVHDPLFLGPPELIIPTAEQPLLKIDYDFSEGPDNDDEFYVAAYISLADPPVDPIFEFYTMESEAGTIVFNLSPYIGYPFALEIVLETYDTDLASTVTVSNVRLEAIPEPATLGMLTLMAAGGFGLAYRPRIGRPN